MTKLRATWLGILVPSIALLLMAQTSPPSTRPGGSTTQVQYNNAGAFAGDAGLTYNAATDTLTVATNVVIGAQSVCQANGTNCPAAGAVETSGTFVASFVNACATTPTVTYDWNKVGNIVVLTGVSSSGFTCTGDTTSFSTATGAAPAAIRPAAAIQKSPLVTGLFDNGALVYGCIHVYTDGTITYAKTTGATLPCDEVSWTASGLRSYSPQSTPFTYMVNNP